MKFGVVELSVDMRGIRASGATDAVWQGIRRDEQRAAVVRRALDHAVRHGCDLVVLPGWTLVEPAPPPCRIIHQRGRQACSAEEFVR